MGPRLVSRGGSRVAVASPAAFASWSRACEPRAAATAWRGREQASMGPRLVSRGGRRPGGDRRDQGGFTGPRLVSRGGGGVGADAMPKPRGRGSEPRATDRRVSSSELQWGRSL